MSIRIAVKIILTSIKRMRFGINMLHHFQRVIFIVLASFFLAGSPTQVMAKQQLFEAYKRVIVLDPGHGGDESGARGPDGATEKTVTLALARLLAGELEREYKVMFTRTDDSQVGLDNRTALANHLKADVFISLHTGGSFAHSTSGTSVYHYQNFSETAGSQAENPSVPARDGSGPVLWDFAQNRHLEKSRTLARIINARLSSLDAAKENRLQGAPLLVLQGADMPAILIEIGYLTNPTEEKNLRDQRYLTDLALAISRGVDEYFEQEQ